MVIQSETRISPTRVKVRIAPITEPLKPVSERKRTRTTETNPYANSLVVRAAKRSLVSDLGAFMMLAIGCSDTTSLVGATFA
jgi:hypothetical protein